MRRRSRGVSKYFQKKGIALKPFIIGLGKDFSTAFSCVGTYFNAGNEQEFQQALKVVILAGAEFNKEQVNLLDIDGVTQQRQMST